MNSVEVAMPSGKNPAKSGKGRLARTFAKVMHIRAVTGVAPENEKHYVKQPPMEDSGKTDKDLEKKAKFVEEEEEDEKNKAAKEAFAGKLFASISGIKAAYAQLQFAQSPYDSDGIQLADGAVVSELRNLSELKQCFMKKQIDYSSPETILLSAEIEELKSVLKMYEITGRKLESQDKLKGSEITFLKEKLEEANKENRLLEKRWSSSGQMSSVLDNLHLSTLSPSHFVVFSRQTLKSVQGFVRLFVDEMESADWDLYLAASSIQPGVMFSQENHICYAFEAFVCRELFDGFYQPEYSLSRESSSSSGHDQDKKRQQRFFFDKFKELKSVKAMDYLAWKPKSAFARFCRLKYLSLIHPKLESSVFANLDQRNSVAAGEFPETTFFVTFAEMAKRVWLLHCLAFSFSPGAEIFQVKKGNRFSEVYMESVNDEAFREADLEPRVAFTVFPGFRIGKTAVQCQVYLC